jgi:hypothetical protein
VGLLRVHPRPASRGTTPSRRTAASPFRRALACTARGIPDPLHDQRRRQTDPRPRRRSPARYLSPLNHAMAWKGHEVAVAAAASCWLWVPKPIAQRWACDVRGTRQAYRRSKLAPFLRRSSSYPDRVTDTDGDDGSCSSLRHLRTGIPDRWGDRSSGDGDDLLRIGLVLSGSVFAPCLLGCPVGFRNLVVISDLQL